MSDSNYNNILITGTAGKLGKAVLALIPGAIGATRNDFDLSKQTEIETYLNKRAGAHRILDRPVLRVRHHGVFGSEGHGYRVSPAADGPLNCDHQPAAHPPSQA